MAVDIKTFIIQYWAVILPVIIGMYKWVTTDLALAISQADKNNDGNLSGPELEDMAVFLVKTSKNPTLKLIPEPILRMVLRSLCSKRKKILGIL